MNTRRGPSTLLASVHNCPLSIDKMEKTKILVTVEFLDLLCDHFKYLSADGKTPATDYRVHKELGVAQQTVSGWRTGKTVFDDETCVQVANILKLDPGYVLSCVHLERATSSTLRDFWHDMALRNTNLLLLAVSVFLACAWRLN